MFLQRLMIYLRSSRMVSKFEQEVFAYYVDRTNKLETAIRRCKKAVEAIENNLGSSSDEVFMGLLREEDEAFKELLLLV